MARKLVNCIDCGKECPPKRHAFGRCSTHYQIYRRRNDLDFFLNEKYTAMVKRTRYAADPRHYGLSVCSREEFMQFCENNKQLKALWESWKSHAYSLSACPSIDRINPNLGYDIGNLQWITYSENSGKDKKITIRAYKDGSLVGEFNSRNEAGDALGVQPSNIYKVFTGQRKSTGGYTFEKVEV